MLLLEDVPRGIRSKNYSSASTAALAYEAEALTPLDTAAITALTGASGSGSNTMRHNNLATSWTPVLSTQILSGSAHMTHVGSYRVWARVYTTSATPPRLRFLWDVGDLVSPVQNEAARVPGASNFYCVDLGAIRLDATTGTHRWQGMIQAIGDVGGENVYVDRLWFVPTDDGYGVLRAPTTLDQGLAAYSARDEFNQTAGNLTGKTLPVGGAWGGAGAATDYTIDTATHTARRSATDGTRYERAGTGTWTNVVVQADVAALASSVQTAHGIFARYTDANNHLRLAIGNSGVGNLAVVKTVASTPTTLLNVANSRTLSVVTTLWLHVTASGQWAAYRNGTLVGTGNDAALATGGTLATGGAGLYDDNSAVSPVPTSQFNNFTVWVPAPDAVLFASQSAELRTDGMIREDSTGTAYGPVSHVTGDLPRLPPSGLEGRSVELFVKASRGDLDQLPDSGIDDISVQVYSRPSWLHIPEA